MMKQREGVESDDTAVLQRITRRVTTSGIPPPPEIGKRHSKRQGSVSAFVHKMCFKHRQKRTIQLPEMDVGMLKRSLLQHYATGWKVAGSIRDEVVGFFNRPNPSSRTITLR
jgi:hypothetical protein